jgi:hypothetical protein
MTRSQLEGIIRTELVKHSTKHNTPIVATDELIARIADELDKAIRAVPEKMPAGIELGFVWD